MLLRENHRLHARNFEAFAAAHVFAGHQVVFAEHIGAGFCKTGAVALIGSSGKLTLLGAYYPCDFVLGGLVAVGTVEGCWFLFGAFVKKIVFFHEKVVGPFAQLRASSNPSLIVQTIQLLHVRLATSYGNMRVWRA
jgi:hypothetical protein